MISTRSASSCVRCVLAAFVAVSLSGAVARAQTAISAQHLPPALHGDSLGDGGSALKARLVTPVGLARDAQGNIYIAERGAHRIRRVDARTGVITTIAGTGEAGFAGEGTAATTARFTQPDGLIVDRDGNLIIADPFNHRIRKLDQRSGIITTVAGTGEAGFSGDGGLATAAQLNGPFGISLDRNGVLYIADTENHRIRRVDPATSRISTVAGNGVWDFAGDGGPATGASFARPHLVVADGDSAVLIGDSFNFRIRQLNLRSGIIRTIAGIGLRGSGGDGGRATDAAITYMGGIVVLPNGDVLVSSLAEHRIRRIDRRTGMIHPVAGTGRWSFDGDGKPALETSLHLPLAMVAEPDGSVLFTDMWNGRVRRIDARTRVVSTVAGSAESPRTPAGGWHFHYHRDSLRAVLDQPVRYELARASDVGVTRGVRYRSPGSSFNRFDVYAPPATAARVLPAVVLVPGRNDAEVRLKDTGGFASWGRLIAASGLVAIVTDHSLGTRARSVDAASDDVAAALDYVRRNAVALNVDTSRVCVMAFSSGAPLLTRVLSAGGTNVSCVAAYYPHLDLTRNDASGWLLETSETRQRHSFASVLGASPVPTLLVRAGREQPAVNEPLDALSRNIGRRDGVVILEHPDGQSGFERARGDSTTSVVVRGTLCFLQRSMRAAETQCVTTPARASSADTIGDGGPATEAFLDRPVSLALDTDGTLYVSEQRSHRVRRVDGRTGVITTVLGTGVAGSSGDGGPATHAQVNYPKITLDRRGNLYVGEVNGYRIRRVDARTGLVITVAGTGEQGFSGDGGRATEAKISRPFGLVVDDSGHLYFTDTEVNRIRRVDAHTGIITTVAGTGRYAFAGDGEVATSASLARPHVLTLDRQGNLVIGDSFNQRIRRIDRRTQIITTIAGAGFRGTSGDNGPATGATFVYFGGLAYDTAANLLVSGIGDHRVRRIDAGTNVIRPFAGTGRWESSGDGGQAREASFHPALELAVNARNDVFVVDAYGGRVRKIDGRTGTVSTVAGSRAPAPQPGDFHVHFDEVALARALDTPVALDLPGALTALSREGLDYTGTGDQRRRMDIYTPAAARGPVPAVVLVHGSAGTDLTRLTTRWNAWRSRGRLLAAAGFAAVTFSHRLNQEGGLERAADDLTTALAYVRARAGALGIDRGRICVVAFADATPLLTQLVGRPVEGVQCLAAFSPILDLRGGPAPFFLEGDAAVRARFSLSPTMTSAARLPPTMLLIGARDVEGVTAPARTVTASARASGQPIVLVEHPERGSEFDRGTPHPMTERVLREWLAFLERSLR